MSDVIENSPAAYQSDSAPIDNKADVHHFDHAERAVEKTDAQVDYEGGDDEKPRTGVARLLRSNPTKAFIRDVALANETELDPTEVKKVELKIWMFIIPALVIDFVFYLIDKTTLSYAALFGLQKDLKLTGTQYSNLSSIFYVGWIIWAIPGNLLLSKFPLAKYLSVNIFLWGVFLMAQAGAKEYKDLLALRFVSGMFEAVADPCFVSICGMWFTREQQPIAIGCWYIGTGIGTAIGGLVGFGIGQLKGSLQSWRYEFLIIGAACAAWAICMGILIPDAPHTARWLTPRQRVIVMARKKNDHHTVEKRQLKWKQVEEWAKDPKTYLFFLLGLSANIPNGGTSNFGTLIVQGLGFNSLNSALLQIPFGVFIGLLIVCSMVIHRRTYHLNIRTYLMAGITVLTVVGFAMMAFANGTGPRLAGYYLTGSSNAVFAMSLSLVSGNVGGVTKKTLTSAAIFLGVSLGNIIGPYAFLSSEAPTYRTGIIVCMASRVMEILLILILRLCFTVPNKRRDKKFAEGDERYNPNVQTFSDLTDWENSHFRYVS